MKHRKDREEALHKGWLTYVNGVYLLFGRPLFSYSYRELHEMGKRYA